MTSELHVVFGAGQVGHPLARLLLLARKRVRIVKRSPGHVPDGCEIVLGDAADPSFCVEAAREATTVYHCMNPPYNTRVWVELVPRYMDNLIAASGKARARLVVLDNVYMLGRPRGGPLNEDSAMNPCSRKGEIRARAADRLFEAHRRGDVIATSGRASDFYGPGGTLTAADTMRSLVGRLAGKLGRAIRVAQAPRWIVKTMAIVIPLMRELEEMLYQWEEPFVIDDRRFRQRFKQIPEDVDQAAADTVTWAVQHYGPRGSLTTNQKS